MNAHLAAAATPPPTSLPHRLAADPASKVLLVRIGFQAIYSLFLQPVIPVVLQCHSVHLIFQATDGSWQTPSPSSTVA